MKFGVEEKHDVFDFSDKKEAQPISYFWRKDKNITYMKVHNACCQRLMNSNSLTNSSYGKVSSYQGRFEWSPRI
jgi:hypothetical protein